MEDFQVFPTLTAILHLSRRGKCRGPGRWLVKPTGNLTWEGEYLTSAALFRLVQQQLLRQQEVRARLQRSKGCKQRQSFKEAWWRRWVGAGGSLPKPAAEDCQPCPHTPRTLAPSYTETKRQRRSSWAELLLRPSPPAFTHLPQEVGPHGRASPPPAP